jgi:glutamate---cysteine ligase / carboxylate-amine ligase
VIPHRFGSAPPWTLGIEEEVFLVDARTLDPAPACSRVVGLQGAELKPEVFECLVELATPVVPDADEGLRELRRLRGELAALAARHGLLVHASAAHALARGDGQPLVPLARYRRMEAELGRRLYRQLVCGLHVHVSIPDPATCLRAFEGVVPWLPVLLARSANSPLAEGEDTGLRSERARRLLEMPSGGTPPVLGSWEDWAAHSRGDNTRRHWDAWPRPEYGTLEVRVTDMQTDARRSAGFAAIVQALVAATAEAAAEPYDRELYARRRARAAAGPPDAADAAALAALVEPVLAMSGAWHLAMAVLDEAPEAERQLAVAAAEGIEAVPRDVVERTAATLRG